MKIPQGFKGFTLIELIIVIGIVLIISSFAIGGIGQVIRNMRFTNTFNKIVLMVQSARNMAMTEKSSAVQNYEVRFSFNQPANEDSVEIVGVMKDPTALPTSLEKLTLLRSTNLALTRIPDCTPLATIRFLSGNGKTQLVCDGIVASDLCEAGSDTKTLTLGIQDDGAGGKQKTFSIHCASGVPQTN